MNQQGITVLLNEQNANMALKVADYAYVLETGTLTLSGTGAELLTNEQVKAAYLGKKARLSFNRPNDTATACQDWLRSTRLGRGSIKSHVRTVKVLGMGAFCISGTYTPLERCNTLDFVPKSCAKGAAPLWNPCSHRLWAM